jgi:GntR family transcriptional regulator
LILRVDPASPVPPYEQIRGQLTTMIATGVLSGGARLPSIRQVASDLGLAGGTVARAYRELESQGAIQTRGRHGTFVAGRAVKAWEAQRDGLLTEAVRDFALQVGQLGVDPEVALARVRRALEEYPA